MKTPAVVFAARNDVVIGDLDVPAPGAQEIQVQTRYSAISAGTEGLILQGRVGQVQFPCVPGYQRCGVVTAVGPGVSGWRVGDRAMAVTGCRSNADVDRAFGAHIGLANTPIEHAYPVADSIDDLDGACAVVAQVGYNAASRATFKTGDWVLVYGDGLVGQCAAQAARAKGARTIVVGRRKNRLDLALKHSADAVINAKEEAVAGAVRKTVGGQTVAVIIDTVQTLDLQKEYVVLLERGFGQIVYSGYSPGEQWADMSLLNDYELTTHFIAGWTRARMEATLELMRVGKMRVGPLMTHVVPYARAPQMYRMIAGKSEPALGVTLDWRDNTKA